MPRLSLRTQLTLLYAVPFLAAGALLLSIPFAQVSESRPAGTAPPGGEVVRERLDLTLFAALLAALLLLAVVLGWLVAGRFLRPLRTIVATARDISATNLHRRLGDTGRGELAELSRTLDDLFARLEATFESQRRFVANAAHELRTPLTAERTLLQVALADPEATTGALRAACQEVVALGAAQERLIDALLTLASGEQEWNGGSGSTWRRWPGTRWQPAATRPTGAASGWRPRSPRRRRPATRAWWRASSPTSSTTPSATTHPAAVSR
ncbi:HAMP domain-containing protein [Phytohabitans flavus]|uniref:HAMP domain-containing protein n=1 Tax=Phytohabitans flavus TaxID=1076124 RepID=UPI00363B4C9C